MNIGIAIKAIRKEKGLTQGDFCKQIGITQTSLSQIELGKKEPSKSTIEKISKAFNVSPILMYVMSMELDDVPAEKKDLYNVLYPTIKSMTLSLL